MEVSFMDYIVLTLAFTIKFFCQYMKVYIMVIYISIIKYNSYVLNITKLLLLVEFGDGYNILHGFIP
jgi:hypothetical protein